MWQATGLFPQACVDYYAGEWWACGSVHNLYPFITSPLYVMVNQYESHQLFNTFGAPEVVADDHEYEMLKNYVVMQGEAMRASTEQVLLDASPRGAYANGLFSPSCLGHGVRAAINGYEYMPLLGDWFFQRNELQRYHRLSETCPVSGGTGELPCNPIKACSFEARVSPPGPASCKHALRNLGCLLPTFQACGQCAQANSKALLEADCTRAEVRRLCASEEEMPFLSEDDQDEGEVEGALDGSNRRCKQGFKATLLDLMSQLEAATNPSTVQSVRDRAKNLLKSAPTCIDRDLLQRFKESLLALSAQLGSVRDRRTLLEVVRRMKELIARFFS